MTSVAMILAGGAGTRLDILAEHRAKPAVPFAGKYRIIDFTLSNCINSGIAYVAVLTQYLPRSLNEHIGIGRPWDFDRKFGGISILPPYHGKEGEWYNGTAQAVFQNLDFLTEKKADQVIILCGDHVYKMDYRLMLKQHEALDADLTIATSPVAIETASDYGILSTDSNQRVIGFEEKPIHPKSNLASMGVYVFKVSFLQKVLQRFCAEKKSVDFGKDIIPGIFGSSRVYSYAFQDYWRDVGTLEEYWKANIELTLESPPFDLYVNSDHNIYTKNWELPPAKFGQNATVVRSLVAGGCIINGRVEDSVISSNVIVEEGASVKNSIIFDRTIVRRNSAIDRTIIDKDVVVGESCQIGFGDDMTENRQVPKIIHSGLNLIGKFARVPAGVTVERNCRILSGTTEEDFKNERIASGETVSPEK